MKQKKNNDRFSYIKAGVTSFFVIAAVILFFFFIFKIDVFISFLNKVLNILQPLILGAVIAFLMNPLTKFLNNQIYKLMNKIFKKQDKFKRFSLYSAITIALLIFVLIISVFLYMVIPEFARTISTLISVLPGQIRTVSAWLISLVESNSALATVFNRLSTALDSWFQNNFVSNATLYATYLASGVINVVNFVVDFLIGLVLAFYLLSSKKTLKRHLKKILYAFFTEKATKKIIEVMRKSDIIFSGFINGKLINALIIGVLCFIGCSVIKIPYVMLISVVIAVTDMIPVFGPYIGAVPCALLVLLDSPIKCVYFVLFIILLQVFDGNVIGPRILGDSTGLSAFWVMVAILLGGGLFGIIGMLIGVPTFAVLYYLFKILINFLLRKKNIKISEETGEIETNLKPALEVANDEQKPVDEAE